MPQTQFVCTSAGVARLKVTASDSDAQCTRNSFELDVICGSDCARLPLAQYCMSHVAECNETLEALRDGCCASLGARRYDYDAAGELRAVEISDDFPSGPCMQLTYAYGELCEPLVRGAPAVCGRASSVGP